MNKFYIILSMVILSIGFTNTSFAQCDDEDFLDDCAELLDEYVFVKAFNVDLGASAQPAEFSYVFSKGTTYMLTVCDTQDESNKMIVELYDRNHKKVATSYLKSSKKHYPKIAYPCAATGVYYLKYKFKGNKPGCGVSILGFNKN